MANADSPEVDDAQGLFSPGELGPRPPLGYAGSTLARAAERRSDAAFLIACEDAGDSAAYLLAGENVVLRRTPDGLDPLFALPDARKLGLPAETVFLGLADGAPRFGLALGIPSTAERLKAHRELQLSDLRSLAVQGLVDPTHLSVLAEAKALLHWHARHRYCANCGFATALASAGWKRECGSCKAEHFPRTDPVVIMLAVHGERCLLGRQARFPPGMWSCLAGFVEPGETIEEAARREIAEEAGVRCGAVRYLASQPWPFPMSLMIGAHAEALTTEVVVDRTELEDARWFSRGEVAAMLTARHPQGLSTPPPVAIAHHIIRDWVETGSRHAP